MANSFSLTNVPVPLHTPLGHSVTGDFKYRVLGFNADTPLEAVTQMYCHRKTEVTRYKEELQKRYSFVACQAWDRETNTYK